MFETSLCITLDISFSLDVLDGTWNARERIGDAVLRGSSSRSSMFKAIVP